jgi:hypothetical protein
MNNLQTLTTERLRALVNETELTLSELKTELDRRGELAQEHEVANLEQHMKSAELSLKGIRDFLKFLTSDTDKK